MLDQAIAAAESLKGELDVGVINARFVKPMDIDMVHRSLHDGRFVVTLEEGARMGGFGSAFIECAVAAQLNCQMIKVLALPDKFIDHGDRSDLLDQHGLSVPKIVQTCRDSVTSNVR